MSDRTSPIRADSREIPLQQAWLALTHDVDQSAHGRWCIGQATAHADRMAVLEPRGALDSGLGARDDRWHEDALAWYAMLTATTDPALPDAPTCVIAGPDAITRWLDIHVEVGLHSILMAENVDIREDGPEPKYIADLIDEAQLAGVFGVPGYTIRAHLIVDPRSRGVEHLLTITTPSGTTLAAGPVVVGRIHGKPTPQAVAGLLRPLAARINDALVGDAAAWRVPLGRGRPFPPLTTAAASPAPTHEPPASAPAERSPARPLTLARLS